MLEQAAKGNSEMLYLHQGSLEKDSRPGTKAVAKRCRMSMGGDIPPNRRPSQWNMFRDPRPSARRRQVDFIQNLKR